MGKKSKTMLTKRVKQESSSSSEEEEEEELVSNPEEVSDLDSSSEDNSSDADQESPPEESEEEIVQEKKGDAKKGGAAQGPENKQVFVSGIPYECSDQEFREFFGKLATHIVEIKMPRYQDSGRCIGYAHIGFDHLEN
jgi:nucleolin